MKISIILFDLKVTKTYSNFFFKNSNFTAIHGKNCLQYSNSGPAGQEIEATATALHSFTPHFCDMNSFIMGEYCQVVTYCNKK